jgi:hypothetical protein
VSDSGVKVSKANCINREEVVGAKGFEPSTSWSRNRVAKILKALSGVAYEIETADFSLSEAVPRLVNSSSVGESVCLLAF